MAKINYVVKSDFFRIFSLFYCVFFFSDVFSQKAYSERIKLEGNYDIKFAAAPVIEPYFIDKDRVDADGVYAMEDKVPELLTQMMSPKFNSGSDALSINNDFQVSKEKSIPAFLLSECFNGGDCSKYFEKERSNADYIPSKDYANIGISALVPDYIDGSKQFISEDNFETWKSGIIDALNAIGAEARFVSESSVTKKEFNGVGYIELSTSRPKIRVEHNKLDGCGVKLKNPLMVKKRAILGYSDNDDDNSTFCSSRSSIASPECSVIERALLYWFGRYDPLDYYYEADFFKSYSGGKVGCKISDADMGVVKFRSPSMSGYVDISADEIMKLPSSTNGATNGSYLSVADVTKIVKGEDPGDYWVGNVSTTKDFGGWVLVLIYSSPNCPPRTISLWDGLNEVSQNKSMSITLNNIVTPASSDFKSYVGYASLDGENLAEYFVKSGEKPEGLDVEAGNGVYSINPNVPRKVYGKFGYPVDASGNSIATECGLPDYDSPDWVENFVDGISSLKTTTCIENSDGSWSNGNETDRTPSYSRTFNFDAHHLRLPAEAIKPGADKVTLTVNAGPQGGTCPFLAYIAMEVVQPNFVLTKKADVLVSKTAGEIEYKIIAKNESGKASDGVSDFITDTLDAAVEYVNGSFISNKPNVKIDAKQTSSVLNFSLPPVDVNDSVVITFRVRVKDASDAIWQYPYCKRRIENNAMLYYKSSDGKFFAVKSNMKDCRTSTASVVRVEDELIRKYMKSEELGPFDISKLSDYNIQNNILEILKAETGEDVSDFIGNIYYAGGGILHPDSLFTNELSQVFVADDTVTGNGSCGRRFTLTFVKPKMDPPLPVTRDTIICLGDKIDDVTSLVEAVDAATYEHIWYSSADVNSAGQVPQPFVASAVGVKKYYVSVRNKVINKQSEIDSVCVIVVGLNKPEVDDVSLCAGDELPDINAKVVSNPAGFYYEGKLKWFESGSAIAVEPIVVTDVYSSVEYFYGVAQEYELTTGEVCRSEIEDFSVSVTYVDAPSVGDFEVNYLKTDAVGKPFAFPDLLSQNPNAVRADVGVELVWYDSDHNLLGAVAPSPKYDPSVAVDEEETYVFYVSQKNADGCESEKRSVVVKIGVAPLPVVSAVVYCENDVAKPLTADKTNNDFELVWYDENGVMLNGTPLPDTRLVSKEMIVDTLSYYVSQRKYSGVESGRARLDVLVYPLPRLEVKDVTPVCEKKVNLKDFVVRTDSYMPYTFTFFDENHTEVDSLVDKSGQYFIQGSYIIPLSGNVCASELKRMDVVIDELNGVSVSGDTAVCSDDVATVTINVMRPTGNNISYFWNGVEGDKDTAFAVLDSDKELEIEVVSGACAEKLSHKVSLKKGVVSGVYSLAEKGNSFAPMTIDAGSEQVFYSCGGAVDLNLNSVLTSGGGFNVYEVDGKIPVAVAADSHVSLGVVEEQKTYSVSYINICPVEFFVKVKPVPLSASLAVEDYVLCEGDALTLELKVQCEEYPSVTWTKNGAVVSSEKVLSLLDVKQTNSGVYKYEVKNRGCSVAGTSGKITVNPFAKVRVPNVVEACLGDDVRINADCTPADVDVVWSGTGEIVSSASDFAVFRPMQSGINTCSLKVSVGSCVRDFSVEVNVSDSIFGEMKNAYVCGGGDVRLSAETFEADSYVWRDADGSVVSLNPFYDANVSETQVYFVEMQRGVCKSVQEVEAVVVPNPEIMSVESVGVRAVAVTMNRFDEDMSYKYSLDNGEYNNSSEYFNLNYGRHNISVVDKYGCSADTSFVLNAPDIVIPPLFSPNGDGVNDTWEVSGLSSYPSADVFVYDRFGKKLVSYKGSDAGWDGKYNGHDMPTTDYWYEIIIKEIDKVYVGHFTLLRQ